MSKPVWSDLMRYLRKTRALSSKDGMRNKTATDHDKGNSKQCQRCQTVYKRPYVKWSQY